MKLNIFDIHAVFKNQTVIEVLNESRITHIDG